MITARSLVRAKAMNHRDTESLRVLCVSVVKDSSNQPLRQQRPLVDEPRVDLNQIRAGRELRADVIGREDAADSDERIVRADVSAYARQDGSRCPHQRRAGQAPSLGG